MKIWIFLPAYNEEESLVNLLPKFKKFFSQERQIDYSILIVDDGSSDGSVKVAEAAGSEMPITVIKHSMNRGLGETERSGFEYIAENANEEDIVIRLDCDDTHEPQYISSMLDKLEEGYDVVNTSRFQPGGYQMGVNAYRSFLSRSANVFMKILFGLTGMRDYSCGFRAYRINKIKRAVKVFGNNFLQMRGFGFASTLEIIIKLNLLGCRFAEVPFGLRYDQKVTESKMVSGTTMLGYIVMSVLYHLPCSGWRTYKKILGGLGDKSVEEVAEEYLKIKSTKSIPSRFGA